MYLRRKCYSSLYDDLYNDYLYDKYFSDIDEDYSKKGAAIGGGIGLGLLGISGLDNIYTNKLNRDQAASLLKRKPSAEQIALENTNFKNNVKNSILFDNFYKYGGDKFKDNLITLDKGTGTYHVKDIDKFYKAMEDGGEDLIKKINRARTLRGLALSGLLAGTALGAGYGIGKLKKKNNK